MGSAIRKLFCNPDFVEARGKSRDTDDPSTFYGSPMAARLDSTITGGLFGPDRSAYTVGFDFVKLFNLKDHSSGVVALRCEDLSPLLRGRKDFTRVLMLIPGPKEPSKVDMYLSLMLREFEAYGPDGNGLVVNPMVRTPDGGVMQGRPFVHTVVLVGQHADSPARSKAGHFLGAAAYLGCPWCWITGKRINQTMAYLGYKEPTVLRRSPLEGTSVQIGVNDHVRLLSDQDQEERAGAYLLHKEMLELSGEQVPANLASYYGACGYSVYHERLPYLSGFFNSFWLVPFCHAVFLGLVKDLVRVMTGTLTKHKPPVLMLSKEALKLIKEREGDFVLTTDFNRPYSSFVEHNGRYVIEDWARMCLVYSTYLFSPDVHDGKAVIGGVLKKAWGHLRRFIKYHYAPKNFDKESRDMARSELIEYGKILEEHCPGLCKQNLHILCCRLNLQEEDRGSVYGELELWIERVVQEVKRKTRYRATTDPEKVAARSITQGTAMDLLKSQYPSLRPIDSQIQRERVGVRDASAFDQADDVEEALAEEGLQPLQDAGKKAEMVGTGRRPTAAEWDKLREALVRYLADVKADGWEDTDVSNYDPLEPDSCDTEVWVHKIARLDREYLASEENSRARSRESFYVKVQYDVRGLYNRMERREYIGKVLKLVRLVKTGEAGHGDVTLRFAICDVYNYYAPVVDDDLGKLYKAVEYKGDIMHRSRERTFSDQFLPVLLETIDTKVYRATVKGDSFDKHYFGTYAFSSGIR